MFEPNPNIDWYRSPIESKTLSALMERSDLRGWLQTLFHLGWFCSTAALSYWVFTSITPDNWPWMSLSLIACLFLHGTMGPFMGLIAIHELQHKTVFKTRGLNAVFERVYAFISWSDYVWYHYSHPLHHRATCHRAHDGEVVLPLRFSLKNRFWLGALAWDPRITLARLRMTWRHARGEISGDWNQHVLATDIARREHRNWARFLLLGHATLALIFILTGNWFLIIVFTFGTQYCSWLGFICGVSQHYGMQPEIADFRANTRTFTCSPIVGFYYWNMQYHIEHHMYPAVPFFNLPKLRAALADDLPAAPHGLRALCRELMDIRKQAIATQPKETS